MSELRITDGKGIHIEMDNGFRISVQIGRGNYSDNYDWPHYGYDRSNPLPSSSTAEIALWKDDGGMMNVGDGDPVRGYEKIEDILRFVEFLRKLPASTTEEQFYDAYLGFSWKHS